MKDYFVIRTCVLQNNLTCVKHIITFGLNITFTYVNVISFKISLNTRSDKMYKLLFICFIHSADGWAARVWILCPHAALLAEKCYENKNVAVSLSSGRYGHYISTDYISLMTEISSYLPRRNGRCMYHRQFPVVVYSKIKNKRQMYIYIKFSCGPAEILGAIKNRYNFRSESERSGGRDKKDK